MSLISLKTDLLNRIHIKFYQEFIPRFSNIIENLYICFCANITYLVFEYILLARNIRHLIFEYLVLFCFYYGIIDIYIL